MREQFEKLTASGTDPHSARPHLPASDAWVQSLLRWFTNAQRDMPWRRRADPYAVWVSEIMLQQTRVDTAIPYFNRFMMAFPTVRELAAANSQDVLKLWEGLGYYSRARNLQGAAQVVVDQFDGTLPRKSIQLRQLPGIGEYTSAAIASICFGEAAPAVDGNVLRVVTRFTAHNGDITRNVTRKAVRDVLQEAIPAQSPGDFNQAMMELGATICTPTTPTCPVCPLRRWCKAHQHGAVDRFPVRKARTPVPHVDVVVAVLRRHGRILVAQRRTDQMLGGLWEFPGGKQKENETLQAALLREVRSETGVEIEVGTAFCVVKHAYSHFRITIHAFDCRHLSGKARPRTRNCLKWVLLRDLDSLPFSTGSWHIVQKVLKRAGLSE